MIAKCRMLRTDVVAGSLKERENFELIVLLELKTIELTWNIDVRKVIYLFFFVLSKAKRFVYHFTTTKPQIWAYLILVFKYDYTLYKL